MTPLKEDDVLIGRRKSLGTDILKSTNRFSDREAFKKANV
jgi:hypothetical protein